MTNTDVTKSFTSLFWTIFGTALLPIVIPWVLYKIIIDKFYFNILGGKVILITGASSGLGEALAKVFYLAGCKIILASRRIQELERVKSELLKLKKEGTVTYEPVVLHLDLLDVDSLPMKAKEAELIHGHIDILINNGGVSYRGEICSTSMDVHINVMIVNYFGLVALTKALLPSMIRRGDGHIVSISSVQGKIAIPYRSAYSASKHALQAFMDCLRSEVAKDNVKVTVINPGYIKTNLSLNAYTGTGDKYGIMDVTTASGYEANYVARKVYSAVATGKNEITVSSLGPRCAILLRNLLPSIYFYIMKKRAIRKA